MTVVVNTVKVALGAGSNVIGAVTQSGTWNVGVTGSVTLGAGSASIGTVAATQSGTWNVNAITTLPALAAGSNVIGAVTQSGTWNVGISGTPTVTVGAGVASIGTVAATQSGTWNIGAISTSITPGTAAANLGKAEDASHASGDTGVMALGVRNDNAATTLTSATGDYSPLAVDGAGSVFAKSPRRPTPYKLNSAASTNATSVSSTANTLLYGYYISNTNAAARYVKFYNKASAPTVGTDTPVLVLAIPGNGAANVSFPEGVNFTTGLAFAITTGAADADTTGVALNEVIVNLVHATY